MIAIVHYAIVFEFTIAGMLPGGGSEAVIFKTCIGVKFGD